MDNSNIAALFRHRISVREKPKPSQIESRYRALMWTSRENRYATALKSRGQQKDADHTFPTLFHRLTTITPERKEQNLGACGAKFNELFFEKKKSKPFHSRNRCEWKTSIHVSAGFQSLRSFTLRAPRKEGRQKRVCGSQRGVLSDF